MQFHLNFSPQKFDFNINHNHRIFLIGSCFSENINQILNAQKFNTLTNPNGILFNPASIAECLDSIINLNVEYDNFILNRNGIYYSYLHHSTINHTNKSELITKIKDINAKANKFLLQSNYLIITFGSAFLYHHLQLNKPVANCHKQATNTFEKKLLSVNEICNSYTQLIKSLNALHPELKIIFTVSPVKHLKDGVVENNISKSTLVLATAKLVNENNNCYYFPAYELVNDDLRDYRFYKEDLAHPNELAINYIWEKFSTTCFNEKTIATNKLIFKINSALNHRKMNEENTEQEKLNEFILKQKDELKKLNLEIEF